MASGRLIRTIEAHDGWIFSARFSPDGQWFASTGFDGMLKLWNTATGELMLSWESQQVSTWTVDFSPDGQQLVSGGDDGTIKL